MPKNDVTNINVSLFSLNSLLTFSTTSSISEEDFSKFLIIVLDIIIKSAAGTPFPDTSAITKASLSSSMRKKS